jgi:hypothetical protein
VSLFYHNLAQGIVSVLYLCRGFQPFTLVELNADRKKGKTSIRLLTGDKDFLFDLLQEFHLKMQKIGLDHQYSVAKDAGHDYREVIMKLEGNSFIFWKEAFRNAR